MLYQFTTSDDFFVIPDYALKKLKKNENTPENKMPPHFSNDRNNEFSPIQNYTIFFH